LSFAYAVLLSSFFFGVAPFLLCFWAGGFCFAFNLEGTMKTLEKVLNTASSCRGTGAEPPQSSLASFACWHLVFLCLLHLLLLRTFFSPSFSRTFFSLSSQLLRTFFLRTFFL
jgi:hypothetical protein